MAPPKKPSNTMRERRGLSSQREIAKKAGMSQQQYEEYESCDVDPTIPVALRIAKAFDTTLDGIWPQLKKVKRKRK